MSSSRRNQNRRSNQRKAGPSQRARQGPPARVSRASASAIVRTPNRRPVGLPLSHHFDAFAVHRPQALAFSVGPATPISGATRFTLDLPADAYKTVLIFQPGGGFSQVYYFKQTGATAWTSSTIVSIASTGITSTTSNTSPDTIMCTRGSLRLRNVSPASDMAGAVHVLKLSTGLDTNFTDPWKVLLAGLVTGHQRTVTFSGAQLSATHQWDCIPVSQDRYHSFHPPTAGNLELERPGLSTIAMVFDHSASKAQTYEFSICANYYARYSTIGPLANSAVLPPTVPLALANRARDAIEQIGSNAKPLLQFALNTLADKALEATPGLLGTLINVNRGFPALPP